MTQSSTPILNKTWFSLLILYIIIDFVRPQDFIKVIGVIRPGLIAALGLSYYIVSSGSYWCQIVHIRMIWYVVGLLMVFVPFASNNFYAYQAATGMLTYMPYILSVVACLVDLNMLRRFINFNIIVMIYVSITGIVRGGRGTGGYFADENDIALYINTILPFCFFYLVYQKQLIWRLIYFVGLILGVICIIISFSRGGFVGLAVIAMVIWYLGEKKILTLFIIGLVAIGIYFWVDESYMAEMKTISDTSESTASWRLMAWGSGLRMFLDNPLGVGGNNFLVRLPEYQPKDALRLDYGRPAHSLWFTLLPELGIIGIILFFRLLYYMKRDLFRIVRSPPLFEDPDYAIYNATALSLICGCFGFLASGTFLSVLYYPYLWYYAAVVAGMKRIEFIKTSTR